jgi:hypothetical protein
MAAVIYSLWEKGDKNPLILPANIPIEDQRILTELTRYLSDNWIPIIEKDVDGPSSLPLRIDSDVPNLGKLSACRRVACTIYLGSAPTLTAANRGIEDRLVKLGCVMPGESPSVFGDALRRLASSATYLYQDGPRYWYSTQPTVTKLAEDRAEQLKRDPDKVVKELDKRLRADLSHMGDFKRVHTLPNSSADVPDDKEARLVLLGIECTYSKEAGNEAEIASRKILEKRGNSPRLYRNTLVFLAADKTRLQDLDEAVRKYLAWESILAEKETLDLSPHQVKQAQMQKDSANSTVTARIPETYQWLLVPVQAKPQSPVEWQAKKLSGQDPLAVRASKKLKSEELLVPVLAGTRLRMELDRIPLWRGDNVSIKQLVEDFASYLYLPRLIGPSVLIDAIRDGLTLISWMDDSFTYADSFDEVTGRYRGLRCGQVTRLSEDNFSGLLVKSEVAAKQQKDDIYSSQKTQANSPEAAEAKGKYGLSGRNLNSGTEEEIKTVNTNGTTTTPPLEMPPKRFFGSVALDPTRVGRDAGKIADELISHLVGLPSSKVKVTLEIEAEVPSGVPDNVVRIVTENSRTLKFDKHGFEKES